MDGGGDARPAGGGRRPRDPSPDGALDAHRPRPPRSDGAGIMRHARSDTTLPEYLPEHLGGVREPGPVGEVRIRVTPLGFGRASQMLHRTGARFVTLLLADHPEPALVGAFAMRGDLVVLRAPIPAGAPPMYTALG